MNVLQHLERLFGRGGAKNRAGQEGDGPVLERDADGHPLYGKDVAKRLFDEYRRRRDERLPLERAWALCAAFYTGNQHCDVHPESGELTSVLPLRDYEEQGYHPFSDKYLHFAPPPEISVSGISFSLPLFLLFLIIAKQSHFVKNPNA